jgi:flagellar basal body-associated protein FliL
MRRKKDDKRVLISPREQRKKNNRNLPKMPRRNNNNARHNVNKSKRNGITVLIMILALVAFVIGAGIGISLNFEDNSQDDGPHWVNVTEEMTTNLNDTEPIYYDQQLDAVDYNSNQSLEKYNVTNDELSY